MQKKYIHECVTVLQLPGFWVIGGGQMKRFIRDRWWNASIYLLSNLGTRPLFDSQGVNILSIFYS